MIDLFGNVVHNLSVHSEFLKNEYSDEYYKKVEYYKLRTLKSFILEFGDIQAYKHHYDPISIFGDNDRMVYVTWEEHKNLHKLLTMFTINESSRKMKNAMRYFGEKPKNVINTVWCTPLGDFTSLTVACLMMDMKEDFLRLICENNISISDSRNRLKSMSYFQQLNYKPNSNLMSRDLGFRKILVRKQKRGITHNSKIYRVPYSDEQFTCTQDISNRYYEENGIYIDRKFFNVMCVERNEEPIISVGTAWFKQFDNPEQYLGQIPKDLGWGYRWAMGKLF